MIETTTPAPAAGEAAPAAAGKAAGEKRAQDAARNAAQDAPALACSGLTKRYGIGKGAAALDNVTLTLERGRIAGLLGPNGAGKTTFIKLINGLLRPSAGEIRICGYEPGAESKAAVSYLPDRFCLEPWMRISDALSFYADFYADFRKDAALDMLRSLGLEPGKRLSALSKGNQEKAQLVLVMARQARLYLLDEPIGGVDPAARDYILGTIMANYAPDAAVLISTHLIQDVESILHDVIFLKAGRVVLQGGAEAIRAEKGCSIDALFREEFKC